MSANPPRLPCESVRSPQGDVVPLYGATDTSSAAQVSHDVSAVGGPSNKTVRALQLLSKLEALLALPSIGAGIADRSGTIVYVNDKFCEVSGYTRDELVGTNHRIVKSDRHPGVRQLIAQVIDLFMAHFQTCPYNSASCCWAAGFFTFSARRISD